MSDGVNHSYSVVFFLYFTFPFLACELMTSNCAWGMFENYSWFFGCLKKRGEVRFLFTGLRSSKKLRRSFDLSLLLMIPLLQVCAVRAD